MKNTYLYNILVCLFLLMGKAEIVYGEKLTKEMIDSRTWGVFGGVVDVDDISEIKLTEDVNMVGVIRIPNGKTLTITSDKNVTIKNTGIAQDSDVNISSGRKRFFTVKSGGKLIIKGNGNAKITIDGGANYTWNDYTLTPGEGARNMAEALANEGTMELTNVIIQNVNGICNANGGAILIGDYSKNGPTTLKNCLIQHCYSELGSAIMIGSQREKGEAEINNPEDCKITITDTTIKECVSGGGGSQNTGGTIRSFGASVSNLYLTRVNMTYNYAQDRKIDLDYNYEDEGNGGALFWNAHGNDEASVCKIEACYFAYNKSESNGGAIKSQGSMEFVNSPTTIEYNKAPQGGGLYIEGYHGGSNNTSEASHIVVNLGENLILKNNLSSKKDDSYSGKGGGVMFYFGNMDLADNSSVTINLVGANIEGNVAETYGGGIYFENEMPKDKGYEVNINLNYGTLKNNKAANGGGIYVSDGDVTSVEEDGKLLLINGNEAFINGGGISLLNGKVNILNGFITNNSCEQYGGGLYVHNSEEAMKQASFTGGNIIQNEARYGGGICVDGNINLEIGAVTVDENEAINGGGICLLNGAKMDFGEGYIRNNRVSATGTLQKVTAFQKSITEVNGIGGGVYLDSNTSLTFSVVNELGLYDNFADNGADDIFANGKETAVSYLDGSNVIPGLPVVNTMKLAGFSVAGEPYWVEDYIEGDTGYANGTCKTVETDDIRRYRTSIQNLKEVYKIESDDDLKGASKKYLCLAIGHDIVYVTIVKQGLAEGESAIFTIELVKDGQEDTVKRMVLLTGNGSGSVSKSVALSTGKWKVTENDWTWAYSSTTDGKSITKTIANGDKFEFVNVKKIDLPLHDEAKVENSMKGVSVNE